MSRAWDALPSSIREGFLRAAKEGEPVLAFYAAERMADTDTRVRRACEAADAAWKECVRQRTIAGAHALLALESDITAGLQRQIEVDAIGWLVKLLALVAEWRHVRDVEATLKRIEERGGDDPFTMSAFPVPTMSAETKIRTIALLVEEGHISKEDAARLLDEAKPNSTLRAASDEMMAREERLMSAGQLMFDDIAKRMMTIAGESRGEKKVREHNEQKQRHPTYQMPGSCGFLGRHDGWDIWKTLDGVACAVEAVTPVGSEVRWTLLELKDHARSTDGRRQGPMARAALSLLDAANAKAGA